MPNKHEFLLPNQEKPQPHKARLSKKNEVLTPGDIAAEKEEWEKDPDWWRKE